MTGFLITYFICGLLLCLIIASAWFINGEAMNKEVEKAKKTSGWSTDWIITSWVVIYLFAWPYILIACIFQQRSS